MQFFEKDSQPHKMAASRDDDIFDQEQTISEDARKESIQRSIQSLIHAYQCCDANCTLSSCNKMKRDLQHSKSCHSRNSDDGCKICKQLIALSSYHAKDCQDTKCTVPFCVNIKHKVKEQEMQERLQQIRHQMVALNNVLATGTAPAGDFTTKSFSGA